MFVRIIYPNGSEVLRECAEVQMENLGGTEGPDMIGVRIDGDVAYTFEKAGAQMYFMNSNGKTIDQFRWGTPDGYGCYPNPVSSPQVER